MLLLSYRVHGHCTVCECDGVELLQATCQTSLKLLLKVAKRTQIRASGGHPLTVADPSLTKASCVHLAATACTPVLRLGPKAPTQGSVAHLSYLDACCACVPVPPCRRLAGSTPSQLLTLLSALTQLKASPGPQWCTAALTALAGFMPVLPPTQVVAALAAADRLGATLPGTFLSALFRQMASELPTWTDQQVVSVMARVLGMGRFGRVELGRWGLEAMAPALVAATKGRKCAESVEGCMHTLLRWAAEQA